MVHELFSVETLRELQAAHPEAITLSHPECPKAVRDASDHVLGTAGMLKIAGNHEGATFLVGTEGNMLYRLKQVAPQNTYLSAPGASCACNLCPHMQLNTAAKLRAALDSKGPRVQVPAEVAGPARRALERMLDVV